LLKLFKTAGSIHLAQTLFYHSKFVDFYGATGNYWLVYSILAQMKPASNGRF